VHAGRQPKLERIREAVSPSRCDYLFALTGDGRRWFIPSDRVEGTTAICLGGPKYAQFEVERGAPFIRVGASTIAA
jgi:hypothetical protein